MEDQLLQHKLVEGNTGGGNLNLDQIHCSNENSDADLMGAEESKGFAEITASSSSDNSRNSCQANQKFTGNSQMENKDDIAMQVADLLRAPFLSDPKILQMSSKDGEGSKDNNSNAGSLQFTPDSGFEHDHDDDIIWFKTDEEEHCHHDDCTPSSGPDYLMENQNLNWETLIYSRMSIVFEKLLNPNVHINSSLSLEYSSLFYESLCDDTGNYKCDCPTTSQTIQDPLDIAKSLISDGKLVQALPLLEIAVYQDASNTEAWDNLASVQYLIQNNAQAISACKQFLRLPGGVCASRHAILILLSTCLLNENDIIGCQAVIFEWAVDYLNLDDNTIRENLQPANDDPGAESDRNWISGLLKILDFVATSKGINSRLLNMAKTVLHFAANDFTSAVQCLEPSLLNKSQQYPFILNQIGDCFHNMHLYEKALSMQDKALQELDGFPRALYSKATTLYAMGRSEEAMHMLALCLKQQDYPRTPVLEQFWYFAASLAPHLPTKSPDQRKRRIKLMSIILTRNINEFKENLPESSES